MFIHALLQHKSKNYLLVVVLVMCAVQRLRFAGLGSGYASCASSSTMSSGLYHREQGEVSRGRSERWKG
eukprot:12485604-Heterocapsa_arctica.AAC.1